MCDFSAHFFDLSKNQLLDTFANWGPTYEVSFDITVKSLTFEGWINVIHFTKEGDNGEIGNRIPALFLNSDSYFHFCSAVNDQYNYQYNYDIVLDHQYHVIIKQTDDTYSINIDGEIVDSQASQPHEFTNIKFYASNPWYNPFSFDIGMLANLAINHGISN